MSVNIQDQVRTAADDLVCQCHQVSRAELDRVCAQRPDIEFEQLLDETSIGRTCSACVLDAEYYFASRGQSRAGPEGRDIVAREERRRFGFARRARHLVYRGLNRIIPARSRHQVLFAPVLLNAGIRQLLVLSNQGFLYESKEVPAVCLDVALWAADGRRRMRRQLSLQPSSELEVDLTEHFPERMSVASDALAVGYLRTSIRYARHGMIGTIRPHVKVLTQSGVSAVHEHSWMNVREGYMRWDFRPADQRMFVTVINAWSSPTCITLTYPLPDREGKPPHLPANHAFVVPAHGSVAHELKIPLGGWPENSTFLAKVSSRNLLTVVHMVYAEPSLASLSLDHAIFR